MEQKHCLQEALKNIVTYPDYNIIALRSNNKYSIVIKDELDDIHDYAFHFILTNGTYVIDTMHFSDKVKIEDYFTKYLSKNTVIDARVSEINSGILVKLVEIFGIRRIK